MTCQSCGRPLAERARFCASCGTPVTAGAESHPTEFHVVGDVMQAVVIPLRGGQEVQAEPVPCSTWRATWRWTAR